MALVKIEEVFLYVATTENPAENLEAVAFMDHSNIPYVKLQYNDSEQLPNVLAAVNTWWDRPDVNLPPLTGFPFLVYTEVHDNILARHSPVKYLAGLDNIKTFPSLLASLPA